MKRKKMGELLVQEKMITPEQLESVLPESQKLKKRVGETVVQMGMVTEDDICKALSRQLKIPLAKLKSRKVSQKVLNLISPDICYKKNVVPLGFSKKSLWIAMNDPTDHETLKDLAFISGYHTRAAIEKKSIIIDFLMRYYPPQLEAQDSLLAEDDTTEDMIQVVDNIDDQEDISFSSLEKAAKGGVIRKLTNGIIANAIKERASDIHIEPQENEVIIRFRVDGIMRDIMTFTKTAHPSVVSRIKIMASLDITERRKSQDGRARIQIIDRPFDLRISSLPTYYGEKIVIRVLEARLTMPLDKIGMGTDELEQFKSLLRRPQGIILITGPTGSGKTTTLYSALGYIFSQEINIVTIEDPVEYSLPGINQVQVNTAAGMTFAKGLRSLLRQDPDVVMIGEIRDEETAKIAFQTSQTGHLVLSTLHTNDAISAVNRLKNMGIEPFWMASSLLCVVAQRLVRKIHNECCTEEVIPQAVLSRFPEISPAVFKRGKGCPGCQDSGYSGRIGIYEMFVPDHEIKKMIASNAQAPDILHTARNSGMKLISEDGFEKASKGLTTLDEIIRTVPPVKQKEVQAESYQPDQPGQTSGTDSGSGRSPALKQTAHLKDLIMVVDDDEAILRIIKKILTNEFYDVNEASDGIDGLKQVFEHPPDLILVDYDMPGMNGIDFIKKLKTHSRMANIPVIMLTASDPEKTEIEALNMGADDWISKPIHKERLLVRIKRLLRN